MFAQRDGPLIIPPDWSRPLPEPIDIGHGKRLTTLCEAAEHILTLSPEQRELHSWLHVASVTVRAATDTPLFKLTTTTKSMLMANGPKIPAAAAPSCSPRRRRSSRIYPARMPSAH
jgi:hypothetical protein